jgi:hypothetical protein
MKWSVESRPVPLAAAFVRGYDVRKLYLGATREGE